MRIILIEEKGSSESPALVASFVVPHVCGLNHTPFPPSTYQKILILLFIYFYKIQFEGGGFDPWMSLLKTPIRRAN